MLERVTREVLADFAADEVVYLELRTTPCAAEAKGMNIARVTETIRQCQDTLRTLVKGSDASM